MSIVVYEMIPSVFEARGDFGRCRKKLNPKSKYPILRIARGVPSGLSDSQGMDDNMRSKHGVVISPGEK
jgi:hypothetical protein